MIFGTGSAVPRLVSSKSEKRILYFAEGPFQLKVIEAEMHLFYDLYVLLCNRPL